MNPARASADITTLAVLRRTQPVVRAEAPTMGGWLIWTRTKMAPATAAAMPAVWPSREVVMVMAGFLC